MPVYVEGPHERDSFKRNKFMHPFFRKGPLKPPSDIYVQDVVVFGDDVRLKWLLAFGARAQGHLDKLVFGHRAAE